MSLLQGYALGSTCPARRSASVSVRHKYRVLARTHGRLIQLLSQRHEGQAAMLRKVQVEPDDITTG